MSKKVVVAMSGGVDSSVAAALLLEQGWEVIGVTLRLFSEEKNAVKCCGGAESAEKARASAGALGIRHYFKSAQGLFARRVIKDFVDGYLAGRTPNPCVECNRYLKFSYLFDLARELGATHLATGHYARVERKGADWGLYRGKDPNKDQSYFLHCLMRDQLQRLLFPLGGLHKTEVRRLAKKYGLPSAGEPESKDICFVTEGKYDEYLRRAAGVGKKPGNIVDAAGKRLGGHDGFFNFTIGQRRGTGVHGGSRLYVTAIRPKANEVVMGPLEAACSSSFGVNGLNWLAPVGAGPLRTTVQIRYRHQPAPCEVVYDGAHGEVRTDKPQFAVAAGQSAVFYEGDRLLGGGIIEDRRPAEPGRGPGKGNK